MSDTITPKLFRKRPVVIEAMQYLGTVASATGIIAWAVASGGLAIRWHSEPNEHLRINTFEETMTADPGDWIIRIEGEFYPCKSDIFEAAYEAVSDTSDLRERAERQQAAYARMLELNGGIGRLGVVHPSMSEDMRAWLGATQNDHADTVLDLLADLAAKDAEIKRLRDLAKVNFDLFHEAAQERRDARDARDRLVVDLAMSRAECARAEARVAVMRNDAWRFSNTINSGTKPTLAPVSLQAVPVSPSATRPRSGRHKPTQRPDRPEKSL